MGKVPYSSMFATICGSSRPFSLQMSQPRGTDYIMRTFQHTAGYPDLETIWAILESAITAEARSQRAVEGCEELFTINLVADLKDNKATGVSDVDCPNHFTLLEFKKLVKKSLKTPAEYKAMSPEARRHVLAGTIVIDGLQSSSLNLQAHSQKTIQKQEV